MSTDRDEEMSLLARTIDQAKQRASAMKLDFAARLLDMTLLEVALAWDPDPDGSLWDEESNLATLLRLKLRLALIERGTGHLV